MDAFDAFSGRMTVAQDPTGTTFGVWQAGSHHGAQLANEPGTLNWNEFRTNDPAAAAAFDENVFGHEVTEFPTSDDRPPYRVIQVGGRGVAGIFQITPQMEGVSRNWSTVFTVADTDETMRRADELGGEIVMSPWACATSAAWR